MAVVAATPPEPAIGSFCTPSRRVSTLKFLGSLGAEPLGQLRHLARFSAATAPNCGYCLPQATTSSRTRSGVGRLSESLQRLTNCPSLSRIASEALIRLFNWFTSPPRAAARVLASFTVLPIRSPLG